MSNTLNLMPKPIANNLAKISPKTIRSAFLGQKTNQGLILVDSHWSDRAIDIQAGDFIQLPIGTLFEGNCVQIQDEIGSLYCGAEPGLGRFYHPETGWSAFVRVSRQGYIGRSIFRHLEDCDDD